METFLSNESQLIAAKNRGAYEFEFEDTFFLQWSRRSLLKPAASPLRTAALQNVRQTGGCERLRFDPKLAGQLRGTTR